MEDLATDRIYRLMIAQRIRHRDAVEITDDNGSPVDHSPEQISHLFDEELEKILASLPEDTSPDVRAGYRRAREISEAMILSREFDPV
jgi:malate synthase